MGGDLDVGNNQKLPEARRRVRAAHVPEFIHGATAGADAAHRSRASARATKRQAPSRRRSASALPNGSALDGSASQFLEPQQHGEHSFELAVEMHLVTTKPLQPVWVGPLRAATERFGAKLDALHKDHKAEIIRLKLQR